MRDKIIDYIKKNRVCTTEVADCLGKSGALSGVYPINRGHFKVGKVKWVYAWKSSNWDVHEQIVDVDEGDVVFVDAIECEGRAIIGQLVSKYLLLYRQVAAIVVNAPMRDAAGVIREHYPIWCTGVNPVGCFNTKPEVPMSADVRESHKALYDGAIMVCDDCGVVVVPKPLHTDEFMRRLERIEEQEDIWFDRLDHKKENTFEIVCLKNYLKEQK